MIRGLLSLFLLSAVLSVQAQQKTASGRLPRPKLVVGIVVDQMRWDYLYRYYERYSREGFRRMLSEGMTCENTIIPYAQTVTAAGHTCVYTGSVPAIHGIMGNEWFDKKLNRVVYCTEDKSVKLVGVPSGEPMSPANMWSNSICDELRLATNFRSKVIGIAIKDRGGILPAGHSANAAYWYDGGSGKWITSSYYMNTLPAWVNEFNNKKWVDSFYMKDWNLLYPADTYIQSDLDDVDYEGRLPGEKAPVFPHELKSRVGKDYGIIRATPYGNDLTLDFSRQAVLAEGMGKDEETDFLAVSLSSTDYVGHTFGPNSVEIEDTYLRLDRELGKFFSFLDREVGQGQYTVFLTADHAVAHVPGYLQKYKMPAASLSGSFDELNRLLFEKYKVINGVMASENYQLYIDDNAVAAAGAELPKVREACLKYLNGLPEVLVAFEREKVAQVNLPSLVREMFINGFNEKRSGDIQVVLKPGMFYGAAKGTTHGTFAPYDAHIPLVWMGWGIRHGQVHREVYMTDIAVTLAALLNIQMPNGAVGKVIPEVLNR